MKWERKGLVFEPTTMGGAAWMASHACFPTPLLLSDRIRVFIAARNNENRGHIGWVDLARDAPNKIIGVSKEPILGMGRPGMFDDSGVAPFSVLFNGDQVWLYYQGWNGTAALPGKTAIGLAVSNDGGTTFQRHFEGPVLERDHREPFFVIAPHVRLGNEFWRMWYSPITDQVDDGKGGTDLTFTIRQATSKDGIVWTRDYIDRLRPRSPFEVTCAPAIAHRKGRFQMWYSVRGAVDFRGGANSYRIGYAESVDGESWTQMDSQGGLDVSADDWESQMVCYGGIVEMDGNIHMFYNGNGFGKAGFGYAVLAEE